MGLSTKRPSRGDVAREKLIKGVTETGEKKRRLNAEIEETLYRKIKGKAAFEGRTVSDITRTLWLEYLSK